MGLELTVRAPRGSLLDALASAGISAVLVMVDGALVAPGAALPEGWRDARLRTPAGTVTLSRRGDDIAVIVFGNADAALRASQEAIARALGGLG